MTFRRLIFWPHLVAGVLAGSVILLMSATGVLLTYERQILAWADSGFRSTVPAADAASALPIGRLLSDVAAQEPGLHVTGVTVRAGADAPVTVTGGQRTLFVDRYSGKVLGESSRGGIRQTMTALREWHRWLGMSSENRALAKAITGWSNFLFLFIVVSGIYLWFPRQWTLRHLRSVMLFNTQLTGRPRDFNWHNVIGFWVAIPLFIVVLGAMPISFPWATALVYRAVGENVPAPTNAQPLARTQRPAEERRDVARPNARRARGSEWAGIDTVWSQAEQQVPGWTSIAVRFTSAGGPFSFAIDEGDGGQPQLKSTLVLDRSGDVVSWEPFSAQTRGRRLRSLLRFAHTGEVLGIPGQTIAGVASAGGVMLVWTGIAMAWRRLRAWLDRRARGTSDVESEQAA